MPGLLDFFQPPPSEQGRLNMFSQQAPQIRQGLLQAAPVAADFTPVLGDAKGLLDAAKDPTALNIGLGLAGLIPGIPSPKRARDAFKSGKVFHGGSISGDNPLYVTKSRAVADMSARANRGKLNELEIAKAPKVLDLSRPPDDLLGLTSSLDSLGNNPADIGRIKDRGFQVVVDSDDFERGFDQALIVDRSILEAK